MYVLISYFSVAQWAFWYTTSCTSGRHSSVKAVVPRTIGRFFFWLGAILAHLSPSRSVSSAINRFRWPSSAMPPRILAAAISAFADSAYENNRCHWLPRPALLSRLPWFRFRARRRLQCQGQSSHKVRGDNPPSRRFTTNAGASCCFWAQHQVTPSESTHHSRE